MSNQNVVILEDEDSNISTFLKHVQPKQTIFCETHKNCSSLVNLFQFFDVPYGLEIPLNFNGKIQSCFFLPCLSAIQLFEENNLIFEFFEIKRPDLRLPFNETLEFIFEKKEKILNQHTSSFSSQSWFSVIWNPLLFDNKNEIKGQILTYHRIDENTVLGFYPKVFKQKFWFNSPPFEMLAKNFKNCQDFLDEGKVVHPDFEHFRK
jgi:hypothetical protein